MKSKASTDRKPTPLRKPAGVRCAPGNPRSHPALALLAAAPPGVALRRVRFGYFKPEARDVHVVGSFNGWNPATTPMRRDSLGDWSVEIELPPGEYRYRFFVDGEWRDDPGAPLTALNPFGGFDAIMVVV